MYQSCSERQLTQCSLLPLRSQLLSAALPATRRFVAALLSPLCRYDFVASVKAVRYSTLFPSSLGAKSRQARAGLFKGIRENDLPLLKVQSDMVREGEKTFRMIAEDYLRVFWEASLMVEKGYLAKLDPVTPALNADGQEGFLRHAKTLAELIAFGTTTTEGKFGRFLLNMPSLPQVDTDDGTTIKRIRCQVHKYLLAISSMRGGGLEVRGGGGIG